MGHGESVLTIGQLAAHAGVSTRTVRHYHAVGLLPEPERDPSGYRSYDAAAVVRLIRIRTLAQAGVPLARVRVLLEADADTFTRAVADIDAELRARIRALQGHRRHIARLQSAEALALPAEVLDYLDRLRALGVPEEVVAPERDAWILMAARWPQAIPEMMADKIAQLDDPTVVRLYVLIGRIAGADGIDDGLLRETADLIALLAQRAAADGQLERLDPTDASFTSLMDSYADDAHPSVARLRQLLAERGWSGWTRIEKRQG